jgi:hypothetical protein
MLRFFIYVSLFLGGGGSGRGFAWLPASAWLVMLFLFSHIVHIQIYILSSYFTGGEVGYFGCFWDFSVLLLSLWFFIYLGGRFW